jgi:hypothetical protein
MASNDDNSRRDRDRPEDNPFIAFRRFADSSVASLLNSVFTLPSTFAQWNTAHQAREQCLFKKGNPEQCAKLAELEHKIGKIRAEGRELYRAGHLQAVLDKGEELMEVDTEANEVRKHIVGPPDADGSLQPFEQCHGAKPHELLEKVGHQKGQEWGGSWDWGFPRPFDADDNHKSDENECRRRAPYRRWRHREERDYQKQPGTLEQAHSRSLNRERAMQGEESGRPWSNAVNQGHPPETAPSPPPGPLSTQPDPFAEIISMVISMAQNTMTLPFMLESEEYSPDALEKDERWRKAGVAWRDAFEDLTRAEYGKPLMSEEHFGHSRHLPYDLWARMVRNQDFVMSGNTPQALRWEGEEKHDELSYEYSHDHEDQHDEPPTPKTKQGEFAHMPATELEAYERLLNPTAGQSSILSTLTTTERTVAADGSVTTKMVLKKRFADGREESSETVHTQRGQDRATQEAHLSTPKDDVPPKLDGEKKRGWFWSS